MVCTLSVFYTIKLKDKLTPTEIQPIYKAHFYRWDKKQLNILSTKIAVDAKLGAISFIIDGIFYYEANGQLQFNEVIN